MLKCLEYFTKERNCLLGAGAVIGVAALQILKTKKARELAVKGVAGGIMLKDKVLENVANIREEAEDICAEAKTVAQNDCNCQGNCDCE